MPAEKSIPTTQIDNYAIAISVRHGRRVITTIIDGPHIYSRARRLVGRMDLQ